MIFVRDLLILNVKVSIVSKVETLRPVKRYTNFIPNFGY